jgi:GNAT superfamily N-acetyltransferase
MIELRRLARDDLQTLIGAIDRSEHVAVQYAVVDGQLVERPVVMEEIPTWDPVGDGDHSVRNQVRFATAAVEDHGGIVLGAYVDDDVAGESVVAPSFEPPLAWFASLHVSRRHRRTGVASALWDEAVDLSRASGATHMYVSATSTGSAVGFYLSRGCRLADPVHPMLFELEPVDIHLIVDL